MSLFQKLINHVYRFPISNFKKRQRFGGYLSYRSMQKGQKEMRKASLKLPQIISYPNGLPIYFLTGKKYLFQTLFCAISLVKSSPNYKFQFILVDDGSFDEKFIQQICQLMPGVKTIKKFDIERNLEFQLPKNKFPYLHYKREVYPHIKKLTDIHTIGNNPYKLVLDSDMLFWNEPTEVINWLKNPKGCLYMLDSEESYGYDRDLMQSLCGSDVPKLMNVGAIGFNSDIINWENLEEWCKTLEEKQGTSYFLEQALTAMIVSNQSKIILNKLEYIVNPDIKHENIFNSKLHHYVDLSKKLYFESAWKKIISLCIFYSMLFNY